MSRCLSEETLLLLYEGEGTREDRAHLIRCQVCTIRYKQFGKDLTLLGRALRDPPPPSRSVMVRERQVPVLHWVPVTIAGAMVMLLLWSHGQDLEFSQLPPQARAPLAVTTTSEIDDEELALFLTKTVGPAIFSTADFGMKGLPQRANNLSYLQAALNGGWPNERCKEEQTKECDSDPFALLFESEAD